MNAPAGSVDGRKAAVHTSPEPGCLTSFVTTLATSRKLDPVLVATRAL